MNAANPMTGELFCARTQATGTSWWRVDLGSSKRIGTVIITVPHNVSLVNYQIRIGNDDDTAGAGQLLTPISMGVEAGETFFLVRDVNQKLKLERTTKAM